jgi:hypothetical protein
MTENAFPQVQQVWSFWENAAKEGASALETAIETHVALSKATFGYAAQVSEQWGKLAIEATRRMTKTA